MIFWQYNIWVQFQGTVILMTIVVVQYHLNYRCFSPAIEGERKKIIHFLTQGAGYKTAGTQASQ